MQKSALRILLISLLVVFSACGSYKPQNATITENALLEYVNPYFSDKDSDYIYKANMDIYGRNLGGIVVIKKLDNHFHRVVFTTDFGNKLLDFELAADDFKVHFVVDGMNNKRLLSVLETDFRMLLQSVYPIDKSFVTDEERVYRSQQNTYLFEDKAQVYLSKIIFVKKSKEKITFEFKDKRDTFVNQIGIIHHNIPFRMQLMKI